MNAETDLARDLRRSVKGEVRFDPFTRALYSTDASIYQMRPAGVVFPKDAEDVAATIQTARAAGVPVLPRGAGTSLAGQAVTTGVVLDFSMHMDRLLELDPRQRWAWVEPGMVLDRLTALAAPHGLRFGPDPATSNRACVGGAIGNNSCGARSIVHGKTLDHVLEIEAVLADGTLALFGEVTPSELERKLALPTLEGQVYRESLRIARESAQEVQQRFPRILRRVSGYNLDQVLREPVNLATLLVGSEGTLAAVTRARVRLVPRPGATGLAVLHFTDLYQAMDATVALLGERPTAIELMDSNLLRQARSQPAMARRLSFVEGDPEAVLLVEVAGDTRQEAEAALGRVAAAARRRGLGYHTLLLPDPEAQASVWAVRRDGLGLLMSLQGPLKPLPFVEDTAVAPERLPEYLRRFDELVREEGTTAAHYGHASVGCIHVRPLVDLKRQEGVDRMERIARRVAALVLEFGGSLSGEHGDGIVRGGFTEAMFGPVLHQAFRDLKRAFDPAGTMNPGKIVDSPPMTENLRTGPSYTTRPVRTALDFSGEGGLAAHVEMCNGQAACRKTLSGAMCPSYMATREEEHSTRGRANALRAVLSGLLPLGELAGRRLHQALDLCLECRACRSECPSGVDMAKLKVEVLHAYHAAHGYSLRDRGFADVDALGRWGSALAPLSNWALGLPWSGLARGLLGLHPARPIPAFARRSFSAWFRAHRAEAAAGRAGAAILFNDTFMEWNRPSVGVAATRLLERMGYAVRLAPRRCCGRPMLSHGMVERARENARHNVDILYPAAAQGTPIVGCEPSCLLTLRDDYPSLLPGDRRAGVVARQAVLLEELIARRAASGEGAGLAFRAHDGPLLLHCHCHERALAGVEPAEAALRLVPGADPVTPDVGCCGMAGAFGFEREHYRLSMAVGERALFPAVRANPGATIVTTGFSCGQQVEHGTGAATLHLAEFLADHLSPG